jgi:hypothetical protein
MQDKDHKINELEAPEVDRPVYRNWDFFTFMKNNPDATEKEIRAFLKERQNIQRLGF